MIMKNFIVSFMAIVSLASFVAAPALAGPDIGLGAGGDAAKIGAKGGYDTNVTDTTLSQSVGKVIKAVLATVGTIFFVLTIYAGFLWMTASGNEEQVEKAKNIIKAAIIGLVICLASYGITNFVVGALVKAT